MTYWRKFEADAATEPLEVEERTPARPPTLESDFAVPLLQSLFTGFLLGGSAGLAAQWLSAPDPWALGLGVGVVATVGTWAALLRQVRDLLWQVRTAIGPNAPEPERPTVRVEVAQEGGRQVRYLDLPGDPERLATLARGVLSGKPLSEAAWTGAGRPFSRAEFAALRAELLRAGLARWRNPSAPAQGMTLTPAGRAVLRKLGQGAPDRPTPPR